MKLALDTIHY